MKIEAEITSSDIIDSFRHDSKGLVKFVLEIEKEYGCMDLTEPLAKKFMDIIINDDPTLAKKMIMEWMEKIDQCELHTR